MDTDVLDSLEDIGYKGPLLEDTVFARALDEGSASPEYTKLVEWITLELRAFFGLEEKVSAVAGPEDSDTFLMELSGFLREYGCPLVALTEGPISQRLGSRVNRIQLLDYLLTELSAARMLAINKPSLINMAKEDEVRTTESGPAKDLKNICVALGFPRPPEGITSFQLFTKVEAKLKEIIAAAPNKLLGKPLLKARLSGKQWESVEFINKALKQEYECRREMLLKRLDVTIQSFKWSERLRSRDDEVAALYQPIRRSLSSKTGVGIPQMLAAREDLTQVQKTSSGTAREKTKCAINRVKIGKVPDRGGRAYDHEIPPPEMPSFMKRTNAPQGQRGGFNKGWSGKRQNQYSNRGGWHDKKQRRY